MVFALMTGRTTEEYVNLFEGLKRVMQDMGLPCTPEEVMLDFEGAAWGALRICFPGAKIRGCGFHWAKCLLGKWKNLGLRTAAKHDVNLRKLYAKFFPDQRIWKVFSEIIKLSGVTLLDTASTPT